MGFEINFAVLYNVIGWLIFCYNHIIKLYNNRNLETSLQNGEQESETA